MYVEVSLPLTAAKCLWSGGGGRVAVAMLIYTVCKCPTSWPPSRLGLQAGVGAAAAADTTAVGPCYPHSPIYFTLVPVIWRYRSAGVRPGSHPLGTGSLFAM